MQVRNTYTSLYPSTRTWTMILLHDRYMPTSSCPSIYTARYLTHATYLAHITHHNTYLLPLDPKLMTVYDPVRPIIAILKFCSLLGEPDLNYRQSFQYHAVKRFTHTKLSLLFKNPCFQLTLHTRNSGSSPYILYSSILTYIIYNIQRGE